MKFGLLILLSFLVGGAGWAEDIQKNDSNFSFVSAAAAFNKARVPTVDELKGKWTTVGAATVISSDEAGYWPDGKFTRPELGGGFFMETSDFEVKSTDALGQVLIENTATLFGAETGKVYETRIWSGVIGATGFDFMIPDRESCNASVECRIVSSPGMLLCQSTNNEEDCSYAAPVGQVLQYTGFMRLN